MVVFRIIFLAFILLIPNLLSGQLTNKEIWWDSGLMLSVSHGGEYDTISLKEIISGKDKTSFLINQNGDTLNHDYIKGKVLLLDYWFLACKPCIAEIMGFDRLKSRFKNDQFEVITFTSDKFFDVQEKLLSKRNFKFHIISNSSLLKKHTYPLKILTDKRGDLIIMQFGGGSISKDAGIKMCEKYEPLILKSLKA